MTRIRSIVSLFVPSFIRRRYTAKFVLSILVVVAAIGAVGGFGYVQARETVQTDTENQLQTTVKLQSDTLSVWLANKRTQTRTLSADTRVKYSESTNVQDFIRRRHEDFGPDVRAIHYVNLSTGEIEATTSYDFEQRNIDEIDAPWADRSVYEGLDNSSSVWTADSTYQSPIIGDRVIAFASTITPGDHAIVLVGSLEFALDNLHQPSQDQSTIILNQNGGTVISGGSDLGVAASTFTGRSGEGASVVARGDRVYAYTGVTGTNWVAVTSLPMSQAFAVADTVGTLVAGIILTGLVSLLLVGVVLGRQTVTPLKRLRTKAEQMESGNLNVDLTTRRTDEIGQLFVGFANMRDALSEQIQQAQNARHDAENAREQAEEMSRHLEQKADEYADVMQACGDGDLTQRMDPNSRNAAMTDIAREFNEMIGAVEAATERVSNFANQVAIASGEVTASADEVRSVSEQVTASIRDISDGAERQNESLQSATGEMRALATTTDEIAQSSNEVSSVAARTAETGRKGGEAAQDAKQGMERIEHQSEAAVSEIRQLESEVAQIDELVEFIDEVARRTNMLALNANIEASRSVDGRTRSSEGFDMVTNEIKTLSEETQEATEVIESRLEDLKRQTAQATSVVEETRTLVDESTDSVGNAVEALDEISLYAERTNTGVAEISDATEDQAESTEEAVSMVSDAASISDRTATQSAAVVDAAGQQTAALSEVSRSASDLAERASHLSQTLSRFETDADVDGDDPAETSRNAPVDENGSAELDTTFTFSPSDDDT